MPELNRFGWKYHGQERPVFAEVPEPGRESVWDYPRPPRLSADPRTVIVQHEGIVLAETVRAVRVLETASPPTFYLDPDDVRTDLMEPAAGESHCEWKGVARYWNVVTPAGRLSKVAWAYPDPRPAFRELGGWFSFYPAAVECTVSGERVRPQGGGFYGGWVTDEIVGPWKGEPGSGNW